MLSVAGLSVRVPSGRRFACRLRRGGSKLFGPLIQTLARRYYGSERVWQWHHLKIVIWPGVFPPGPTLSTAFMLAHISRLDLDGRLVLDLGCGTGALAIQSARQGATAIARDINPRAVANCQANAARNGCLVDAAVGDLLDGLAEAAPALILVNPPYYPKEPLDLADAAWNCGRDHTYFRRLFAQFAAKPFGDTRMLMVLSEDCDLARILGIADAAGLVAELVETRNRWGEWQGIFAFGHTDKVVQGQC